MEVRDGVIGDSYLDAAALQSLFNIRSPKTLRRMIAQGQAPPPDERIGGRIRRWDPVRLRVWLDRRAAQVACEDRVRAGDPAGARRELRRLEKAVEELERHA